MKKQLIENIDYYFDDNGLMVFTGSYLKERGYCCENGCRHCPYRQQNTQEIVNNNPSLKNEAG